MAELSIHHPNPNPNLFDKHGSHCVGTERFEILNEINRGAFGVVYRARDKISNEIVAMKEELEGLSPSTLAEINILESLPYHPSIVTFKQVAVEGDRVFVVMEHLKYDLVRARAVKGSPFALVEIKYLVEKILKGVRFLHDKGVMHRDLKPENVLLGGNEVKICDFGLAVRLGAAIPYIPGGVGTIWYKAPEVLEGSCKYTCEVDMWSVGCMMAEFVLDRPLFPGRSDEHQLAYIRGVVCGPNSLLWRIFATFSGAAALSPSGRDLLGRMLAYDPSKRISAKDALEHAWFNEL